MEFNKEQSLAINTLDKNIGLIAGAGTGKTAVLTERFLNIVKSSKKDIKDAASQVLCITFTKKSTEEMQERIEKRLAEYIKDQGLEVDQSNHIDLNIYTIHGFCNKLIKANTYKLGLKKDYEIIEGYKSDQILQMSIDQVIDKAYDNKDFQEFLISEQDETASRLKGNLKVAYMDIRSKGYNIEDFKRDKISDGLEVDYLQTIRDLKALTENLKEEKIAKGNHGLIRDYKAGIFDKLENNEFASDEDLIGALEKLAKNFDNVKAFTDRKTYVEIIKSLIIELESKYLYKEDLIYDLLVEIDQNLTFYKEDQGLLGNDDLLYIADGLLADQEILSELKDKYSHIMIDEYQDTNILQRNIFYKICTEDELLDRNNLFVVGDPKQSIYGFRGSDFGVFEDSIEDIKKSGGQIIELVENYRSSEKLINFFNDIFPRFLHQDYGRLNANQSSENSHIEVIQYEDTSEEIAIARKIKELGKTEKYKDMAVLFRSATDLKSLEDALSSFGISYINPKSRAFYDKREIKDLILFVKFLTLKDDYSLYGLLRSSFFMVEDEDISILKAKDDGLDFAGRVLSYQGENTNLQRASRILQKSLERKDSLSVYENIAEFVKDVSFKEFLALGPRDGQAIENVNKFLQIAMDYTAEEGGFLNDFLIYIENERQDEEQEARVQSDDAVNLMTIHSAKGLEFPIVFIFQSSKKFSSRYKGIVVHKDMGLGLNISNLKSHYEKINDVLKEDELKEHMRIFYVGLTRAKRSLYLFYEKDQKIPESSVLDQILNHSVPGLDLETSKDIEIIKEKKFQSIATDESELVSYKRDNNNKSVSSISAYKTFEKCKRLYYYSHHVKLENIDFNLDQEFITNKENITKDNLNIDSLSYGTLIHSLIENYDHTDIGDYVNYSLDRSPMDLDKNVYDLAKKHLRNFKKQGLPGRSYLEYDFILGLDQGRLRGAIDQVLVDDKEIRIVDFKTNRVGRIQDLVNYYKDQVVLYSYAIKSIFDKWPRASYINFLDFDKLVEIQVDDKAYRELEKSLNNFLSFIGKSDNIDSYECNYEVCDTCLYKNICLG